jgi:Zn-dependent peptidase ImmA (M78 family)
MGAHLKLLAHQAMLESIEVRDRWQREMDGPIDVYALCKDMGVRVRFVPIASMEGLYGRSESGAGTVLLSSLRPLPRRAFSCAHELGHHVFGHGSTIDDFVEGAAARPASGFEPDEFLADTFAGFLLMPTLGVRKAFARRGWNMATATPVQVYTVACHFGVGYDTLIAHMAHSLRSIPRCHADELKKVGPKAIRELVLGAPSPHALIVADEYWELPTLDAETGTLLLLPAGAEAEGAALVAKTELPGGRLYEATRPGIVRVTHPRSAWAVFVRVARYHFAGLAEYRHLDIEEDDDE